MIIPLLGIHSLGLLYLMDEILDAKITVKVIDNQWYRCYEYLDYVNVLGEKIDDFALQNFEPLQCSFMPFDIVKVENQIIKNDLASLVGTPSEVLIPTQHLDRAKILVNTNLLDLQPTPQSPLYPTFNLQMRHIHFDTYLNLLKFNNSSESYYNYITGYKALLGYSNTSFPIGNPILPNISFNHQVSESLKWKGIFNFRGLPSPDF